MVRLELMRLNTAPALDPARRSPTSSRWPRRRRRGCARSAGCRSRCSAGRGDRGFRVSDVGRGARPDRRRRCARSIPRVPPSSDLARHHQRGVLRRAEGGARPRHEPRRQRRAPVPRGVDDRDEGGARLRRLHLQLHRLARRRPDRLLRLQRRQQPAGHDQVPALRQAARRAGRRRQHLSRAGAGALLGAVDRRRARSSAPPSPTTGSTCTPAATSPSWSAC